jgi:hypothetical protein
LEISNAKLKELATRDSLIVVLNWGSFFKPRNIHWLFLSAKGSPHLLSLLEESAGRVCNIFF